MILCISSCLNGLRWHFLSRRVWAIAAIGFIGSSCSAASLSPLETSFDSSQLDELIWAQPGPIDVLHPHRTTNIYSWQVMDQIYDTLLAFDAEGTLKPNLAREWQISDDGLAITFLLNDGIQCHDGSSFDAEDVRFTVEQALNPQRPSLTRTNWGTIARVEVVSPLQVTLHFSEPFGAFLPFMADPFASMMCDTTPAPESDDPLQEAIGTGPWIVERWTPDQELVLKSNPTYVNYGRPVDNPGPPRLQRLIIQAIPDAYSRLSALRWNDAHLITDPPLDEIEALKANEAIALQLAENTGQSVFFQFTVSRPPFNDKRARQAIAHAIDPEAAIAETLGDLVSRERCPVAAGVSGHDPDWCDRFDYDYNPERARELLAELGYGPEKPLKINLMTWIGDSREAILEVFQEQLAEVGIEATLDSMDISTLNARVKLENEKTTGPGSMDLMGWAWYDADILYALWHSPGAYSGYQSQQLDGLLEKTRSTVDLGDRKAAILEVQAYLLDNAVVIPVYTPGWLWIYASKSQLQGFKLGAFNRPLFNDATWATDSP